LLKITYLFARPELFFKLARNIDLCSGGLYAIGPFRAKGKGKGKVEVEVEVERPFRPNHLMQSRFTRSI